MIARRGDASATKVYWSPFIGDVVRLAPALLLLADVGPQLVQFDPADADADHHAVVQLGAAAADREREASHGLAVDAGEARDGADGQAFQSAAMISICLSRGEVVHGGPNPTC